MEEQTKDKTLQYTFRIPETLKARLEEIANSEDRSLSKQIISILRRYIAERPKPPSAD